MLIDDFHKIIINSFKEEYPDYNYPELSDSDRELYKQVNMKKFVELAIECHLIGISLDCLAQDIINQNGE